MYEVLPNACLSATARNIFDVLTARQEPGGLVHIRQQELAQRLGLSQSPVSRAIGQLQDKGIISERQRKGTLLIHPLLAGYESLAHMTNHIEAPDTHVWPINFPVGDIRPRLPWATPGTRCPPATRHGESVQVRQRLSAPSSGTGSGQRTGVHHHPGIFRRTPPPGPAAVLGQ
ncbi:helix-turn-helix transcriptional regulator [Streptomyces cyaneofuscatus]|uniref:helix-turn-helix transcriptional regulator n=1 Tax=Streptomyces cyaneofuscatus TaxID=66883 RepID=UPI00344AABFD